MDMILAVLFIFTITSTVLNDMLITTIQLSSVASDNARLSILIQVAHEIYNFGATPKSSDYFLLNNQFTKVGYFEESEFNKYLESSSDSAKKLGLSQLDISTEPPSITSPSRTCVMRRMVSTKQSINPDSLEINEKYPISIWVCGE